MQQVARRIAVKGRVQGVSFRAWTRAEARRLGLGGWVMNLPDGSVLIQAEGPEARVDELLAAVHRGPPRARVRDVTCEPAEPTGATEFAIRR